MLNGIDPILIFQVYKLLPVESPTISTIPLASQARKKVTVAVVPLYLSEKITGLYIDDESKNIDVDTQADTLSGGEQILINQKLIQSTHTVNIVASRDSIGLQILLAISEFLLDKVTSQEYEVTYMHGSFTVFGGLLHGLSFDQNSNDTLQKIKLELSRGRKPSKSVEVQAKPDAVRLGTAGTTPPITAPTVSGGGSGGSGQSVINPRLR